jgi:hypothetical protein
VTGVAVTVRNFTLGVTTSPLGVVVVVVVHPGVWGILENGRPFQLVMSDTTADTREAAAERINASDAAAAADIDDCSGDMMMPTVCVTLDDSVTVDDFAAEDVAFWA